MASAIPIGADVRQAVPADGCLDRQLLGEKGFHRVVECVHVRDPDIWGRHV